MAAEAHWQWMPEGFGPVGTLPLTDRGFRYGLAVFETLRVQDGQAWFVDEHIESLARACHDSEFPLAEKAFAEAARFLRGNLWPAPTGVARVHVTGGDGGPADPVRSCRVFIGFEPREPPSAQVRARGYRFRLHPEPFRPIFGGRKTHNYWPNIAALQAAQAGGFDEALLFDAQDHLISASLGNVFVAVPERPEELLTPPVADGARAGIIRAWLLKQAGVSEARIERQTLTSAGAVFITNSWLGVMPPHDLTVSLPPWARQHCRKTGIVW